MLRIEDRVERQVIAVAHRLREVELRAMPAGLRVVAGGLGHVRRVGRVRAGERAAGRGVVAGRLHVT